MKRFATVIFTLLLAITIPDKCGLAGIIAPELNVNVYASVIDPVNLTFDNSGNLFVGRDNVGSGGGNSDEVPIHHIAVGGSPVIEFGDPIFDPDAVVFDAAGTISGTAGSVLVGGGTGSNSMARLTAILPDGTTSVVFTAEFMVFNDINQLDFDNSGRLLLRDDFNIFAMTGPSLASRTTVVSFGSLRPSGFAVAPNNHLFVGLVDGTIREYANDGTLINGLVASGLIAPAPLFAENTLFEDGLYALDRGTLLKVDTYSGGTTEIASGIDPRSFFNFGTDGALYISEFDNDRVLRLAPIPEPTSLTILGIGAVSLFGYGWRRKRTLANEKTVLPHLRMFSYLAFLRNDRGGSP